ncbi:peptidoglycan-binding domain-containing protein [Streptomyces sp. CB03911]|uniref:peptidoglycan-binding domain-containing protein n=1 Tax=Streptomyces sp. CB03911 TaxID=1804758 RepID=UPI0018FE77CB|nr:peptidoglycan-binding domain-containing protein [Streptomyces sp. CB03911]
MGESGLFGRAQQDTGGTGDGPPDQRPVEAPGTEPDTVGAGQADAGRAGSGPADGLSRTARRRRILLAVAAAAALVSVGGLAASSLIKSPAERAARTAPPPATVLTAAATMQVLNPSVVLRGTVYPPTQYDVTPVSASAEITRLYVSGLEVKAGDQVVAGRLLAEVSGQPLFALAGAVPAYRDLKPGSTGPDIAQLQDALAALGLPAHGDDRGAFGAGTARAVTDFYARLGHPVPTTGALTQQAVDTARKAADTAQQSVDTLAAGKKAASGATADPSAAPAGTGAGATGPGLDQQLATAKKELTAARAALAKAESLNGPMVPAAHVVFLPAFPATVTAVNGSVGSPVSGPLLSLTSGGLSLTGQLTQAQAVAVRPGMPVEVLSEAGNTTVTGTVGGLGAPTTVAPAGKVIPIGGAGGGAGDPGTAAGGAAAGQGVGGGGGKAGGAGGALYVPLTVTPNAPLPAGLNGQNVRITVLKGTSDVPVLTVPVAAVFTTSAGRTSVTRVDATGLRSTLAVTLGATDKGFVGVTPADGGELKAGDLVVVGQ